MTLNFGGGSDQVPTYSLADLRACAQKNDADFFRRNFAGKVVLFGSKLDVEDRKTTTRRFISAPQGWAAEKCVSSAPSPQPPSGGLISGVYVQAAAVNNLLRARGRCRAQRSRALAHCVGRSCARRGGRFEVDADSRSARLRNPLPRRRHRDGGRLPSSHRAAARSRLCWRGFSRSLRRPASGCS